MFLHKKKEKKKSSRFVMKELIIVKLKFLFNFVFETQFLFNLDCNVGFFFWVMLSYQLLVCIAIILVKSAG